jgi:hypothetical protein
MLSHTTVTITGDINSHVTPNMQGEAAAMEEYFRRNVG